MNYIKAMLRGPCLPLSFCNHCFPKYGTYNGVRFLFVYVELSFFRELFNRVDYRERCRNSWDFYFIGFGIVEADKFDMDFVVRAKDWTFQGDDITRPIVNLEGLEANL